MARSRVVLNRRAFGEQVMQSAELERQLRPYADDVAAQIPGPTTVRAIRTGVGTGNARVRLRVEAEFHERERLVAAIRAVLSNAQSR
ncbi:hypothetical protein DEI99_005280 [Curtobacterium sp. MCLR17_036]|uniref:hypothetical protein n=1 Tax=Curtobacterium sp. MCLR17_036 TaxID=2175620 RepID=UPI000DA9A18E|nr:hypothetical protein [Curtobacterium sp. MCLR17_036]WIE65952.1 hypothetical protein DEI99_005280 [Curtobacterium sp. MCLR17_036]